MPKTKITTNRHPVDRLADIREKIKGLKEEEDILRSEIMRDGNYVGDTFMAVPKTTNRRLLDRPTLELRFGKAEVDACCKDSAATTLNLFKKVDVASKPGLLD
jgi:hypothetical protein